MRNNVTSDSVNDADAEAVAALARYTSVTGHRSNISPSSPPWELIRRNKQPTKRAGPDLPDLPRVAADNGDNGRPTHLLYFTLSFFYKSYSIPQRHNFTFFLFFLLCLDVRREVCV